MKVVGNELADELAYNAAAYTGTRTEVGPLNIKSYSVRRRE